LGKTKFETAITEGSNKDIINSILAVAKKYQIKQANKNNYTVIAKAIYNIEIKLDVKTFHAKLTYVETKIKEDTNSHYKQEINNLISSGPIGLYTVLIQKNEINGTDFSNNKIIDFKGIGGPSNLFLSLIIPGLGVSPVTGGNKSGLTSTILTYSLIGIGIGCKIYSNSEYDKYENATVQSNMNTYYQNANTFNQAFYIITAAGVLVWIHDIIRVANKGFKNQKEQIKFKKNISFYSPNDKTLGISCIFKF
jgi:hypothetical protein